MINWCRHCSGGKVRDPRRKWWQFWRYCWCGYCGGDGFAKPDYWPERSNVPGTPAPPPVRKK